MSSYDFDLFVLGAGSAGVRASRMSAAKGARVAVCEDRELGGTCVNIGCVPKKLMVYGSEFPADVEDARGFGFTVDSVKFDWPTFIKNKNAEIERLNVVYGGILERAGVQLITGRGTLTGPHSVEVAGKTYTAEHILVAVGGWPVPPDIQGHELLASSNEMFFLDALPERTLILGGGYIAVEFAGIMNGFGSQTTLAYRGDLILRGFDHDLRQGLQTEMKNRGVEIQCHKTPARAEKIDHGIRLHFTDGSAVEADVVLAATGRAPKTKNLGLEQVGVRMNEIGAVIVDKNYRSSVPSILAIGDVVHRYNLTPVALAEGMAIADNLFGETPRTVDYSGIATAVFSQPNLATVGLTEDKAREEYGNVEIYRSSFRPMKFTMSGREERTIMKLVVDKETDRVLGCHMLGPDAGEIIQGLAVALKCGATKAHFDSTIGIHPTAAEEFVTMRTPVNPTDTL